MNKEDILKKIEQFNKNIQQAQSQVDYWSKAYQQQLGAKSALEQLLDEEEKNGKDNKSSGRVKADNK